MTLTTVLIWLTLSAPLAAQRPARLWHDATLSSDLEEETSVVFQGRLTLRTPFRLLSGDIHATQRFHLWLTDGTPAGTELVLADAVLSNPVVVDDRLLFVGVGGPEGSRLLAHDGDTVTTLADFPLCDGVLTLRRFGDSLFISGGQALFHYSLTTQTRQTLSLNTDKYLSDGTITGVFEEVPFFEKDRFQFRRINGADDGLTVWETQSPKLYRDQLFYTSGRNLHMSDGTIAGTTSIPVPETSPIQRYSGILGGAGDLLLLLTDIPFGEEQPLNTGYLSVANLDGTEVRPLRENNPILVRGTPSVFPDAVGDGLFFEGYDDATYYSNGTDAGTQEIAPAPAQGSRTLHQVYHHQNDNFLIFHDYHERRRTSIVYRSVASTQATTPVFAEEERHIRHIYGPLGDRLLVAYRQTGPLETNGVFIGLFNPDNGTLGQTGLHPYVIAVDAPLSHFAQVGNVTAVKQGSRFQHGAWLQLYNTATQQSHFLETKPHMMLSADNGKLFIGYSSGPYPNPYYVGTWDETTAQVAPLFNFTANFSGENRFRTIQRGDRTAVWTGARFQVHQAGQSESTTLFVAKSDYLGEASGAHVFRDAARIYIVSPDLTTLTTRPLSNPNPAKSAADDTYAYIAWNEESSDSSRFARIIPATGNIQAFSLPDLNRRIGDVLSLSPQRVLVTEYDETTGTGYLLSINTDNQAVTPLLTLPSACIADDGFALVKAGNRAFFSAFDEATGLELWGTDGTVAGTGLITDLYPGPRGANPTFLKTVGTTLTFRANDPVNGSALWRLASDSNTPTPLTDPALAGGVGFRALGGNDTQLFLTTNERDLWWYQPQFPVTFTAPDLVCDDGTTFSVRANAIHPDSRFSWVVTNADLIEGQNTDTVRLRADGNGDVHIELALTLGETTATETTLIPLSPPSPAQPGTISGPNQPCLLATNQTYEIAAVTNATGYEWSVPADAAILSGGNTTQIRVNFGSTSGAVQVRAVNGCGTGEWRTLTVNLTTDAIAADAGPDRPTCDTSIRLAAQRPVGTTGFWRILAGDVTLSDETDPNATMTFNSPADATLAWHLLAGACPSPADTVTIRYVAGMESANAGPDQDLCEGRIANLSANMPAWSSGGLWSIIAGEGGRFTDAGRSDTTFFGRRGERYLLQWRLNGTACGESVDTVAVVFQGLDEIQAPANQTIRLGESVHLDIHSPRGRGYWNILIGPNRDLTQFNHTDTPTARFTPTHGGPYRLVWEENPSACDTVRVSTWITVIEEPGFSHRLEAFARPAGAPQQRVYAPGVVTPDGLILREGEQTATTNLVITDGDELQMLLEGDRCTKVYPLPDGGLYVIAVAESNDANYYYRAAGADTFTFITGREWVGSCAKDEPETFLFYGDRLYFTLGNYLYSLDPTDFSTQNLVNLNSYHPDLFVWQGHLYAAGEKLWRFNESTQSFDTLWSNFQRKIEPPVARTSRGLFFTTVRNDPPNSPTAHLVYSNGTEIGTTTLTTAYVSGLTTVGDLALFHTSRDGYGNEPWLTDGTEAGTRLLTDIDPGAASNAGLTVPAFSHGGFAFFFRGGVLWRTDGTATTAYLNLDQLHWYTTFGENLILWNGRRLLQTPAAGTSAQATVLYELGAQDLAELDLLAVWQNRLYLQRSEQEMVQVLALSLDGSPPVTIEQNQRPMQFAATYLGAWDTHMLLIDAGNPFTLNRYDAGGAVTPLLQFDTDPTPATPYPIGDKIFFTAGAAQTLYRTDGNQATVIGSPALHHVDGVQTTDLGLLFFAENGDGHRRAYFCGVDGEPQVLGQGVQPIQPRSDVTGTRFHRLGESAHALFFLEDESSGMSLWRWSANRVDAVLVGEFAPGQERAIVVVAEAQNDRLLFQISNRLYRYRVADDQVTDLANGDLRYQGTFEGDTVFLIGETQLGWCDTQGTWHLTDLRQPLDTVYGKSQGYWLVHSPEHTSYHMARLRVGTGTPGDAWGFAEIDRVIGQVSGALVYITDREIGFADVVAQSTQDLAWFGNNPWRDTPLAVTDHRVYFSDVPDKLYKIQLNPLLEMDNYSDHTSVEIFDVFPGPGVGSIQWLRRLGSGVVVCALVPGQGQTLWHINDFSATRLDHGASTTPDYRVMAADDTHLVIADIGAPNSMVLHHVSAETTMFPDPILADALLAAYDVDGNGHLDEQERATVTELDLSGLSIQFINGLQFLPNLRYLDLSDNLIMDWSPLLEHPSFGQQPGSYLNHSLNPETITLCAQFEELSARLSAFEGELVSNPTKTYGKPRYSTWPTNNVLQLLRPNFVPSNYFYWEQCRIFDLKGANKRK